jgi:hypothetical protein
LRPSSPCPRDVIDAIAPRRTDRVPGDILTPVGAGLNGRGHSAIMVTEPHPRRPQWPEILHTNGEIVDLTNRRSLRLEHVVSRRALVRPDRKQRKRCLCRARDIWTALVQWP